MPLFSKAAKPSAQTLRVIHFASHDWGFTDAAQPRVQELLRSLEEEDVEMFHSGLTLRFRGEEKQAAFDRVRALLEQLLPLPEFEGFKIGIAQGLVTHPMDDLDVIAVAVKNAKA
ncbi:MAG TPA: hypothetical protein PLB90_12020 [Opitutaceae bacterium]|nr:hypothetical protein [Opitutaceae bacterium]